MKLFLVLLFIGLVHAETYIYDKSITFTNSLDLDFSFLGRYVLLKDFSYAIQANNSNCNIVVMIVPNMSDIKICAGSCNGSYYFESPIYWYMHVGFESIGQTSINISLQLEYELDSDALDDNTHQNILVIVLCSVFGSILALGLVLCAVRCYLNLTDNNRKISYFGLCSRK